MKKLLPLLLLLLLLAGCAQNQEPTTTGLSVVATTGMIADLAENIGGEHVTVHALMGPGVDPHLYVASEGDVELLQNADLIFYNGLFLEAQMDDILKQLAQRKTVVPVAEHIDPSRLLPWATYQDEFDPHVWFDVQLWMIAAEAVRDTLVEADADHAEAYRTNAEAFLAELAELDAYVRAQAERVPAEQRVLITAHDAFHYFGRAYGFEVRGLQGISTASEAGTADVRELADFIVEHQIPAIFVESSVPVRNVEALQAGVQDRGFDVAIGGSLFSDAMGDPDTPEGTYIGMVRHNIDTVVGSLLED
jgi:manganese/zinc/iron transport system substrate-binding protein